MLFNCIFKNYTQTKESFFLDNKFKEIEKDLKFQKKIIMIKEISYSMSFFRFWLD